MDAAAQGRDGITSHQRARCMTRRWLQWLKSRSALPFRAPRIIYIERKKYVLRGRRWFRSTEALERYIKERVTGDSDADPTAGNRAVAHREPD
jgi:hypothetical protein